MMYSGSFSGRGISTRFIMPLLRKIGWSGMVQFRKKMDFAKGCIIARGGLLSVLTVLLAAPTARAEPVTAPGDYGLMAGPHLVVFQSGAEEQHRLAAISVETGRVLGQIDVPEPEYSGVPVVDAWKDTIVLGANGHHPDAPLANIYRIAPDGTLSHLRSLHSPEDNPCISMTFALDGPSATPHLTVLCQEGDGRVIVSEGNWPDVTLATAFRFDLSSETVLGTAVMSRTRPRSALVAQRGLAGHEGWALVSLTGDNRVSTLIDGKVRAPIRVIGGDHLRLKNLVLTGDPGRDATLGFDLEGQGGWRFLPPGAGDIALLADTWQDWLAIGWAAPETALPWGTDTAQTMRVSLYKLDRIVPEHAAIQPPLVTMKPVQISRLWMGNGALVLTTPAGVVHHDLSELTAARR